MKIFRCTLDDFIGIVDLDQYLRHYRYRKYYSLVYILKQIGTNSPYRFKKIKDACKLEEFDSEQELAAFLIKLIKSTHRRSFDNRYIE